jgi:hypothetical protein
MPMKCRRTELSDGWQCPYLRHDDTDLYITTLLIAVGALILAVAGRAALDPEVVGYGMRRDPEARPMLAGTSTARATPH